MSHTTQKAFRLPNDVVTILNLQPTATEYVVQAIREKASRDRDREIESSLQCLAFDDEANDISDLKQAQEKVIAVGD